MTLVDLTTAVADMPFLSESFEPVACAEVRACAVAAQPIDLRCRDDAPIACVSFHGDTAGLVPAAQCVEAHPERRGCLTRCVELLRHRLGLVVVEGGGDGIDLERGREG